VLVKNPDRPAPGKLYSHDIGNYLTREHKLERIREFASVAGVPWEQVVPNSRHDWINQRGDEFQAFEALGSKAKNGEKTVFSTYSHGLKTNRDNWVYSFSRNAFRANLHRMIDFYNDQVDYYEQLCSEEGAGQLDLEHRSNRVQP
jgi:predicted helicase